MRHILPYAIVFVTACAGCSGSPEFKEGVYSVKLDQITNTCDDKVYASEQTWVIQNHAPGGYLYTAYADSVVVGEDYLVTGCDNCDDDSFISGYTIGRHTVQLEGKGLNGSFTATLSEQYQCDLSCLPDVFSKVPKNCRREYALKGSWVSDLQGAEEK